MCQVGSAAGRHPGPAPCGGVLEPARGATSTVGDQASGPTLQKPYSRVRAGSGSGRGFLTTRLLADEPRLCGEVMSERDRQPGLAAG